MFREYSIRSVGLCLELGRRDELAKPGFGGLKSPCRLLGLQVLHCSYEEAQMSTSAFSRLYEDQEPKRKGLTFARGPRSPL
jgi:hypothetical protein